MHAFLLEQLFPTGWRRSGDLFWRLSDAERESKRCIRDENVRGVRVLSVRVNPDAVIEITGEGDEDAL